MSEHPTEQCSPMFTRNAQESLGGPGVAPHTLVCGNLGEYCPVGQAEGSVMEIDAPGQRRWPRLAD